MKKHVAVFFTSIAIVFLTPVIGTLAGAFMGWVVGLFFADAILGFLAAAGLKGGLSMWQVGASMGFLGSFLRTNIHKV